MVEREKEKSDGDRRVVDFLKKIVNTGVGAAFLTEDVVKNLFADIPLPKDLMSNLSQGAKSTKEEFVSLLRSEFKNYLDRLDWQKELERVLDQYDIEVSGKISFNKKSGRKSKSKKGGETPDT